MEHANWGALPYRIAQMKGANNSFLVGHNGGIIRKQEQWTTEINPNNGQMPSFSLSLLFIFIRVGLVSPLFGGFVSFIFYFYVVLVFV